MYTEIVILLLIYLLKHIIYQYCQFYLPTLDKLFLNVYFQTENTRIYIIMIVYVIHYTCLTIILCTCYYNACIVYVECACLMSVYSVEPEESIGSERRRCFPRQTMFSCVWGCDISATLSCVIYIYEAQTRIYINIFSHNYIMQTKIVLIARSVESMICIHVVDIVMSRPMIFHNDNTCTLSYRIHVPLSQM